MTELPVVVTYEITTIEILGSLAVLAGVFRGWFAILRNERQSARLCVAEDAINGLSFKLAATILKVLAVQSWTKIGMLFAIVALRTLLKAIFKWDKTKQAHISELGQR